MALGMAEGRCRKEKHFEVRLSSKVFCSAQGKPQASTVSGQLWEPGKGNSSLKGDILFGTADLFPPTQPSCNPDAVFHIARCVQFWSQRAENRDVGLTAMGRLQWAIPQF